MSNAKRIVIAVIVVAVIAVGAVAYALVAANNSAAPEASHDHTHEGAHTTDSDDTASIVTYSGSSFSLSKSQVTTGSNVKITNDSSAELDFGSDPHPTHTDNPELNAGNIAPGESKTITLNEKGEWGFHNHFNPSHHGTITVK